MSRKKLTLVISLIVSVAAIAGGIVYAQEATTPQAEAFQALVDADLQEPQQPNERSFSFFVGSGAYLGVAAEDISKENMARYGMREVRGVGVTEILKDSPAEKAGLKKDDVILSFDGESVTSVRKLTRLVSESSPDQTVRVTVSRGGAQQELTATLAKHDLGGMMRARIGDEVFRGMEQSFPKIEMGEMGQLGKIGDGNFVFAFGNRRIGVSTQTLTKQLADYFGVRDGGVLITSVSDNSPAAKAGLKAGDVITAIDGERVSSPGDISRGLSKKDTGDVSLTIVRDRNTRTVNVTPEKNDHPNIIRPGTMDTRRIVIPSVQIPAIPEMNIRIPQIVVPATPPIDVTIPRKAPGAPTKTRVVII